MAGGEAAAATQAPGAAWRRFEAAGVSDRLIEAGPAEATRAVVFLHGNPGSADDFEALVAAVGATGRRAVAFDLPDFGETTAPDGFEHSVPGYAAFVDAALSALAIDRVDLVIHDFGGPIGLTWIATNAERLVSLTLVNMGILPGYRWHRFARMWRTPILGEAFMGTATRPAFRFLVNSGEPRGLPRPMLDRMFDQYDRRTRRAVLKLYRATDHPGDPEPGLEEAIRRADPPTLVIWGDGDSYLPVRYAERQREYFPRAEIRILEGSGHWPFADAPEQFERLLLDFLQATPPVDGPKT